MRGSKVGDSVWVEPLRGKRLHGAVIAIDPDGVRTVATDEGHTYHVPDELHASDQPANVKTVEELRRGDCVVLRTGVHRMVESVSRVALPPGYRIEFTGSPSTFAWQECPPGTLWRLALD